MNLIGPCEDPVFIVGSPRSGTTVLQRALREHVSLWGSQEAHFLLPLLRSLDDVYDYADRRPPEWYFFPAEGVTRDEFLQHLGLGVSAIFTGRSGGRRWVEHTPSYVLELDGLTRMFPRAPVLYLQRDGRQVVSSVRGCWWGREYTHEQACEMWSLHTRAGLDFLRSERASAVLFVSYETLVSSTHDEMARIYDFIGEPFEPASAAWIAEKEPVFSSFPGESSRDKLRPRWTAWSQEERESFHRIAGDLLIRLGYERDDAWTRPGTGREAIPAAVITG